MKRLVFSCVSINQQRGVQPYSFTRPTFAHQITVCLRAPASDFGFVLFNFFERIPESAQYLTPVIADRWPKWKKYGGSQALEISELAGGKQTVHNRQSKDDESALAGSGTPSNIAVIMPAIQLLPVAPATGNAPIDHLVACRYLFSDSGDSISRERHVAVTDSGNYTGEAWSPSSCLCFETSELSLQPLGDGA